MKKTIKLAVVAALALGATSAFATNGDVMIGQGAKSRAMGGVGVATSFGAESALANPAMINSVKNMEFTGAVTYFSPSVSFGSNAASTAAQGSTQPIKMQDSETAASIIPEISFAQRINENIVYGVSINGVAGMGTDYEKFATNDAEDNGALKMKTSLSILKVSVPIAYSAVGFTLGLAPVFQYGMLQMNHLKSDGAGGMIPTTNPESSDTGFGFELGLSYDMKAAGVDGLTLAAVYKSKIEMEYANNIGDSLTAFGVDGVITSGDKLDQPSEYGVGISYTVSGSTIAFDYKNIAWSDAAGYGDFGWEDQTVLALGYEYATSAWAVRIGYNYGASPITEQDASYSAPTADGISSYPAGVTNFFNLSGFPGVVESHITLGGGYNISDTLSLDAAFVYAPEVTVSYDTTGLTQGFSEGASTSAQTSTADVTHSQMGVTIAATYAF